MERFAFARSPYKRLNVDKDVFGVVDVCSVVVVVVVGGGGGLGIVFGDVGGELFILGGGGIGGIGAGGSFRVFGEDDVARFCSI